MSTIQDLRPSLIWGMFEQVLRVPRPSDHENRIREFLIEFAEQRNLEHFQDQAGNLLIRKPSSPGKEDWPGICLQSHLDMVCEKNGNVEFDFLTDSIKAYIDGEWVKAQGTTLGADDGIGIAAQMAVLDSDTLVHGPLECLFTVAEETGLNGAYGLQPDFLRSHTLINLDSEDEGELFIGCAGGIDLTAWLEYVEQPVPPGQVALIVGVRGLTGGHSGDDIHRGRGNANKILNRFLWQYSDELDIRIAGFKGGNLRNAIAREASAHVILPEQNRVRLLDLFHDFSKIVSNEFSRTEPGLECYHEPAALPDHVIDIDTQYNLLNSIYACPHGVYAWSQSIPGLVETSSNLAAVRLEKGLIKITTSQRSSVDSAKSDISNMVKSVFLMAGGFIERSTGYPGWNPNPDSHLLRVTEMAYSGLFGVKPLVKAIHAGLECGLFLEKYPGMDMISFGPTIKGVHSPDERLNIPTVEKFWNLLVEVLARLS